MQIFSFYVIRISLDATGLCSFAVTLSPALSQCSCGLQLPRSLPVALLGWRFLQPLHLQCFGLAWICWCPVWGEPKQDRGVQIWPPECCEENIPLPGAAAVLLLLPQPRLAVPPKGSTADSCSAHPMGPPCPGALPG